ncbi:MAG TPA: nitronate monooxygenase [Candidatus Deferrimicrobium sp.]|nr:nitronate monooxygenase [Candidatus Deferrimicrobium sp.]
MIKTQLTEMLGIDHPIIQGGMGPFDTTRLAIAVSNAGALGVISTTGIITGLGKMEDYGVQKRGSNKDMIKEAINYVNERTNKPFGVNIPVPKVATAMGVLTPLFKGIFEIRDENPEIKAKLKTIITSAGDPKPHINRIRKNAPDMVHIQVVPAVSHAIHSEKCGTDIIVASGHEGGGHINPIGVHSMVLLPAVLERVKVPVMAAGGFGDGLGLAIALKFGAIGIQMGTRFIATQESDFIQGAKDVIVKAGDQETVVTQGLIGHMRYWRNYVALALQEKVNSNLSEDDIMAFEGKGFLTMKNGDVKNGLLPMGEIAGRIHDIPTCKELIDRIIQDAEKLID